MVLIRQAEAKTMNKQVKQRSPNGSHFRSQVATVTEVRLAMVSGIVTGDASVSYWQKLTRSSFPLVTIVATGSHVTCQHFLSIVPNFLLEPGVKSRKHN